MRRLCCLALAAPASAPARAATTSASTTAIRRAIGGPRVTLRRAVVSHQKSSPSKHELLVAHELQAVRCPLIVLRQERRGAARRYGAQPKVQRLRRSGTARRAPRAGPRVRARTRARTRACASQRRKPRSRCPPRRPRRLQLKNAEEAKQHMEGTGHTNFEESTEAVAARRPPRAPCLVPRSETRARARARVRADRGQRAPQVLQLVCKACGKPCRSETEKQMHMKRNPDHTEFVDQTAGAGPVDYSIQKEGAANRPQERQRPVCRAAARHRCFADRAAACADPMDLDEETRKAIAAATGKDLASIEKVAASKGKEQRCVSAPGGLAPWHASC